MLASSLSAPAPHSAMRRASSGSASPGQSPRASPRAARRLASGGNAPASGASWQPGGRPLPRAAVKAAAAAGEKKRGSWSAEPSSPLQ